jgi:Ca2+/H+ antiporter
MLTRSAALVNQLQLAVNIFLGSVLCGIGLTVPVMLAISQFTGHTIYSGSSANDVILLLTLIVSVVTFPVDAPTPSRAPCMWCCSACFC